MLRFSMHLDFTDQAGASTVPDLVSQLRMLADRIEDLVLDAEPRPVPDGNTGRDAMPITDYLGHDRIGQWKIAPSPRG